MTIRELIDTLSEYVQRVPEAETDTVLLVTSSGVVEGGAGAVDFAYRAAQWDFPPQPWKPAVAIVASDEEVEGGPA